ncbi:hypothetical protein [Bacteroides helcogenes]|nr:hypothetical protein [Bacteroides helcogenes]MDY5237772.1 hypothetical protein [Bacteroides helcogenes]
MPHAHPCANDEPAGGAAQDLPEGMYPLQIANVIATNGKIHGN